MQPRVHNFKESLARSHSYSEASWWFEVYRQAFPTMITCSDIRADGWAQRGGIDRVITLASGKTLNIDEKVRETTYNDILLEYWSSVEHRRPGWIAKDLATDYIAYAFAPSKTCYLLPFHNLRAAWKKYGKQWVGQYKECNAKNHGYTTRSVAVPIDVLMPALTSAMIVHWGSEAA